MCPLQSHSTSTCRLKRGLFAQNPSHYAEKDFKNA